MLVEINGFIIELSYQTLWDFSTAFQDICTFHNEYMNCSS